MVLFLQRSFKDLYLYLSFKDLQIPCEKHERSISQKFVWCLVNVASRWWYTRRFATTIFSATQHYNIVATSLRMVATLFQHCYAVLRSKSSLRIVSCNITFKPSSFYANYRTLIEQEVNHQPPPKSRFWVFGYFYIDLFHNTTDDGSKLHLSSTLSSII